MRSLQDKRSNITQKGNSKQLGDGTHKHEKVRRFLERHPRFKVHYIPTSSSQLNLVERWFAKRSGRASAEAALPVCRT
jgi:transposase